EHFHSFGHAIAMSAVHTSGGSSTGKIAHPASPRIGLSILICRPARQPRIDMARHLLRVLLHLHRLKFSLFGHTRWQALILTLALSACTVLQGSNPDTEPKAAGAAASSTGPASSSPARLAEPAVANPTPVVPVPRAQILPGSGSVIGKLPSPP